MKKIIEGVFIEGKPLEEHLIDEERDDKSHEIEDIRKSVEGRYKKAAIYSSERKTTDTRRVSKRVVRFTDRQIRKEYGIMAKPFETHHENVIWCIVEKGPITTQDIGVEIEWPGDKSSLSATASTVWKTLGNSHPGALDIIERDKHGMTFLYRKKQGVDMSIEAIIDRFNTARKKQLRQEKRKQKNKPKPKREVKRYSPKVFSEAGPDRSNNSKNLDPSVSNELDKINAALAKGQVMEAAKKNIVNTLITSEETAQYQMALNVTGRIDIVFKFEK